MSPHRVKIPSEKNFLVRIAVHFVPGIIAASTKRRNGDPLSPRNRAKSQDFRGFKSHPFRLCLSGLAGYHGNAVINIFIARSCPNAARIEPLWPLRSPASWPRPSCPSLSLPLHARLSRLAGPAFCQQLLIPLAAPGHRTQRQTPRGADLSFHSLRHGTVRPAQGARAIRRRPADR